jgi:hypothetical protein
VADRQMHRTWKMGLKINAVIKTLLLLQNVRGTGLRLSGIEHGLPGGRSVTTFLVFELEDVSVRRYLYLQRKICLDCWRVDI